MAINFKKQLWIGTGIIVGSIILASIGLYILAGGLSAQAQVIMQARELTNEQTSAVGDLAELKAHVAETAPYQAAMDQLFPTQDGLIAFPQWLDGIVSADQVSANSTFGSNVSQASAVTAGQIGFSFEATGSLDNLTAFLKDVESKPGFLLQITSFDLTDTNDSYQLTGQGNLFFHS